MVIGGVFYSGVPASGAVPGAKSDCEDATPEELGQVRRMEAVCGRHGVPLAAAALQFPLGHDCVTSVIPGAVARIRSPPTSGISRKLFPRTSGRS